MNIKKAAIYTLGCKVNQYESEAVGSLLSVSGYELVNFDDYADVYIINTCTVTGIADKKCRQIIRKSKKINPDSIVVAMGCYSQVSAKEVADMENVDIVIGTNERKLIPQILKEYDGTSDETLVLVGDIMDVRKFEDLAIETYTEHTRAFLKVQDGCNRYCSYCIIPYARGPVRSKEPEQVMSDIKHLSEIGYKEFVLTGIHLASYGADLKNIDIGDLVNMISGIEGVERIRLGSVEPLTITPKFIDIIKDNKKVCPHFHISLQSGSDSVLKRMNRRYTSGEYYQKCLMIRENIPDAVITTDVIAGFPGETEEEFFQTVQFVQKVDFTKIHVFKYSSRKGTKAADMPNQTDNSTKEKRSAELIKISEKMAFRHSENMIGKYEEVLIEKKLSKHDIIKAGINNKNEKTAYYEGHCRNYMKIIFGMDSEENIAGLIKKILIVSNIGECLLGTLHCD